MADISINNTSSLIGELLNASKVNKSIGDDGSLNLQINQTTQGTGNADLGKDAFLKILMMQLSNQDPLEPMSDTDFIAQLAQFSTLEQMQQMNGETQAQRAQNLIGMGIEAAKVLNENGYPVSMQLSGTVEAAIKVNGEQHLLVGGYLVPLSAVVAVMDVPQVAQVKDESQAAQTSTQSQTPVDTAAQTIFMV